MICTSEKGHAYFLSKDVSFNNLIIIIKNFFGFFQRHINKEHITEQFDLKAPFYNKGAINNDIANITALDARDSDFKSSLKTSNLRSP